MSAYAAILYARRHFNIFFKDPHVVNTRYDDSDLESGLPVYHEDPVIEVPVVPVGKEDLEDPAETVRVNVPEARPNWVSKVFSAVSSVFRWK